MKTWKKVASAALAAMVFASLTAGCGGGDKKKEAANSNEIVVGASFELTGNVANYGKSTLSGLKMAFDEVNKAGGIDGKNCVSWKAITSRNLLKQVTRLPNSSLRIR
jgi:branched-chain amino acid transport system substrate-binding protein